MSEHIESEIRKALDAKAYEVDVPDDLATQTLARAATVDVRQPLTARYRAWRESRRMALPASGYPRWLLAPAAGLAAAALFAIGAVSTMEPKRDSRPVHARQEATMDESKTPAPEDAVAGQVVGVVSAGDASVDATNHADDVQVETGEALAPSRNLEPQLVRTANIRVAVRNFERSWADANEIAADHDGAVIDSKTRQVADRIAQGTIRMRVPSNKLEAVLKDLRELGTVAELETSGDDISKQMADVADKTNAAQDREKELKELESRATTVSERLDVQNRLEATRKDIENLEKKQTALRDQVDTSIVDATIFQDEVAAGRGASIIENALRTSAKVTLTILAGTLVLAGALLPLALIAAAFWWVRRRVKGN